MPATIQPDKDGKYRCHIDGCTSTKAYDHPQHLGIHRLHTHGIKGASRPKPYVRQTLGRPPRNTTPPALLSAEDICAAALEALAPNGSIPISAIPEYNAWVAQTQAFFAKLLG